MPGVVADTINREPAITASTGFPITTHASGDSDDAGGRDLFRDNLGPAVRDEALEVRKLRDRKVGRPP